MLSIKLLVCLQNASQRPYQILAKFYNDKNRDKNYVVKKINTGAQTYPVFQYKG